MVIVQRHWFFWGGVVCFVVVVVLDKVYVALASLEFSM